MKLFLIGELPMLFKDKRRRSRHEHNSKKCRLTLGSSGTFLFDKKQSKVFHLYVRCVVLQLIALTNKMMRVRLVAFLLNFLMAHYR